MTRLEEVVLDCLSDGIETTELIWSMLEDDERALFGSQSALQSVIARMHDRGIVLADEGRSHHGTAVVTWWESVEHADRHARLNQQLRLAASLRAEGTCDFQLGVTDPKTVLAAIHEDLTALLMPRGLNGRAAGRAPPAKHGKYGAIQATRKRSPSCTPAVEASSPLYRTRRCPTKQLRLPNQSFRDISAEGEFCRSCLEPEADASSVSRPACDVKTRAGKENAGTNLAAEPNRGENRSHRPRNDRIERTSCGHHLDVDLRGTVHLARGQQRHVEYGNRRR